MTDLSIQLIPNTDPPRFRWKQRVNTFSGYILQECEGALDPSVERAVKELIKQHKELLNENNKLRVDIARLLSVAAEKTAIKVTGSITQERSKTPDKVTKVGK